MLFAMLHHLGRGRGYLKDLCDLVQLIAQSVDPFSAGFGSVRDAIIVLFEGLELIYFACALLHLYVHTQYQSKGKSNTLPGY